jgi:MFS family permease
VPLAPIYGETYKRTVLGLLLVAYTLNFIDRTIISTIGQAIKVDLVLSDTQLGVLGGLAFALLYTTLGVPIARLAERWSRVNIIAIAIVIWSAFTAFCGIAQTFTQLLLYRAGVGVGEAGLSPAAHSLISDYFEAGRRASALAVYAFGIPIGGMIGAIAGGWIAQTFGWRWAFVIVGVPGVLIALAMKAFIKDPPRGYADRQLDPTLPMLPPAPTFSLREEFRELFAVAKTLFGKWPIFHFVMGITLTSFADYGIGVFSGPYFMRQFGLDLATVGLVGGLVGGISTGAGTLIGGYLTDWLSRRTLRAYALVPAIGLFIAAPTYAYAYLQENWHYAVAFMLIPGVFHYTYLGPTFGVIQNVTELRRRATTTAVLFFFLNLIGLGGGPPFVGWLIDQLTNFQFTHSQSLGPIAATIATFLPSGNEPAAAGTFLQSCPGGVAPDGASADLVAACAHASAVGTRQGILVTLLIFAWSGLHYLMGSIGLAKLLREKRERDRALPKDPAIPFK